MERQLYKEVKDSIGTKCIEVSEEEVKAAKEEYAKTGKCNCIYIYDEPGFMYDLRYCGICGGFVATI